MYKILIVSPFFWPFAGVGAERMGSLVEYLSSRNKYEISVLKNDNNSYMECVLKSKTRFEGVRQINVTVKKGFFYCYSTYRKKLLALLNESKYDCIVISVGPYYTFPLVSEIKKKFSEAHVVLDIRDLWAHEMSLLKRNTILEIIKNYNKDYVFQRKAIKIADVVTIAGEDGKALLEMIYGKKVGQKTFSVCNGFNDVGISLNSGSNYENKDVFNLCIFGKFAEYLSDNQLDDIAQGLSDYHGRIKITQIGNQEDRLTTRLKWYNIEYINTGYLDYEEGIIYLKENATAFFLSNDLKVGNGTKVYDYILCDKPIIYFGIKNTGVCEFLKNFRNAFICSENEELLNAIITIKRNRLKELKPINGNIKMYSREIQNRKFEQIILECCMEDKFDK